MGLQVIGAVRPVRASSLADGSVFVVDHGAGQMFGMVASTAEERFAVIFGAIGEGWHDDSAGWIRIGELADETVLPLPGATIELVPGPLGYPVPSQRSGNGSILLDEDGEAWIFVHGSTLRKCKLATGQFGEVPAVAARFNEWRIVWQSALREEPFEVFRFGKPPV